MFEKHVATLIYICTFRNISYSVNHNLVLTHQQSCQTALTDLIDRWLKFMDDGNLIGTIYLKKAFDTVDHFILGIQLHYYKISRHGLNHSIVLSVFVLLSISDIAINSVNPSFI